MRLGSKTGLLTLLFIVFLLIFEYFTLDIKYIEPIFLRWAGISKIRAVLLVFYISFAWIAMTFFVYVAFSSKWLFRIISFLWFCLALGLQYSYFHTYKELMEAGDFKVAFYAFDPELWNEAASSYFDWIVAIPFISFAILLVLTHQNKSNGIPKFLFFPVIMTLLYSIVFKLNFAGSNLPIPAFISFHGASTFAILNHFKDKNHEQRKQLPNILSSKPGKNVVFIVDESIRGDHLSINGYYRETTPFLKKLVDEGKLSNWGIISSSGTCSVISNNILLSGVNIFPDLDYNTLTNPTIFQFAQSMSYKTWYFDAQKNHWWNGNNTDIKYIDEWVPLYKIIGEPPHATFFDNDLKAAKLIKKIVGTSTGNFIFVTKRGVHFPYNKAFPNANPTWSPIMESDFVNTAERQQLVNSYDNGIYYNTESFFKTLIDSTSLANTIFIYTSDHGQTLSENGEVWTHCGSTKNEVKVPFFIISKKMEKPISQYPASHFNIFATTLDILEVPRKYRQYPYSISLFDVTKDSKQRRFYIDTTPYGINPARPIWYDKN